MVAFARGGFLQPSPGSAELDARDFIPANRAKHELATEYDTNERGMQQCERYYKQNYSTLNFVTVLAAFASFESSLNLGVSSAASLLQGVERTPRGRSGIAICS